VSPLHALRDDDETESDVIEVKVVASSAATLLAGITIAVLNALQADSLLLATLPPWAQFAILAAAPPMLAFAAGFQKRSNRV